MSPPASTARAVAAAAAREPHRYRLALELPEELLVRIRVAEQLGDDDLRVQLRVVAQAAAAVDVGEVAAPVVREALLVVVLVVQHVDAAVVHAALGVTARLLHGALAVMVRALVRDRPRRVVADRVRLAHALARVVRGDGLVLCCGAHAVLLALAVPRGAALERDARRGRVRVGRVA